LIVTAARCHVRLQIPAGQSDERNKASELRMKYACNWEAWRHYRH